MVCPDDKKHIVIIELIHIRGGVADDRHITKASGKAKYKISSRS